MQRNDPPPYHSTGEIMKRLGWQILLGGLLVACSALLYMLHFSLFHDARHIFIYLLGDIAFLPIE
jgi:hypothetical protein